MEAFPVIAGVWSESAHSSLPSRKLRLVAAVNKFRVWIFFFCLSLMDSILSASDPLSLRYVQKLSIRIWLLLYFVRVEGKSNFARRRRSKEARRQRSRIGNA